MSLKINKLYIKNFKVFKELTISFDSNDLIVFDGPNGFGKTSLYDAIELLLTGQIRRYQVYKDQSIFDSREARNENPFYHDNGDGDSIIIKAEVQKDDDKLILMRKTPDKAHLNKKYSFEEFKLFNLANFDSTQITH